jgi:alpha-glucosidase
MTAPRALDDIDSGSPWWRDAVIYQIYVRSFADSNGDGIGDLPGIRNRLAHLPALGVDAIWLTPFYPSPQADAGYDVAEYCDVDPLFGSLADFDALVEDAHGLGIKIIVDIVPNHTSDRHRWFVEALASGAGSPERARYIFRPGRGSNGQLPPNYWQSNFGGPAWTVAPTPADAADGPAQWYLHLFAPEQPDLDWTNEEVRAEFDRVLRFWLDRGVDGFRIDVAHGLAKDPELPDLAGQWSSTGMARTGHPHWDREDVHDVYRRWRRIIDEYPGERMFVGEVWLEDPNRVARYLRPGELHTAFNFHLVRAGWDCDEFRTAIDTTIAALAPIGAAPTWVLSNHDVVREVTRYGGGQIGLRRARAAALVMLALPGAAYVYQGEELGLFEVEDLPAEARQDPTFARTNGQEVGRDGCRVPIPWSGDEPSYGFGPGGESWLPQPREWGELGVATEAADPSSTLTLFCDALRWRHDLADLGEGPFEWIDAPPGVLAFRRGERFICISNFGESPVAVGAWLQDGVLLLATSPVAALGGQVPANSTVWLEQPRAASESAPAAG